MTILLALLLSAAAITSLLATAMAFALYRSDAAGNGLAQAYTAVSVALAWSLLAPGLLIALLRTPTPNCPLHLPWIAIDSAVAGLYAAGIAAQFASLRWLFERRTGGPWLMVMRLCLGAVPLALLLHAAWRGLGLPLPAGIATGGCGVVAFLGVALPWLAPRRREEHSPVPTLASITYPALLLQARVGARVLRGIEDARRLPAEAVVTDALVIDASRACYRFVPVTGDMSFAGEGAADRPLARDAEPMPFSAICDLVLGIDRLHADPREDTRIRRLIGMQRDVTALSFVLPR